MNPVQALSVVKQVVEQVALKMQENAILRQALSVLDGLVQQPEMAPVPVEEKQPKKMSQR